MEYRLFEGHERWGVTQAADSMDASLREYAHFSGPGAEARARQYLAWLEAEQRTDGERVKACLGWLMGWREAPDGAVAGG